VKQCIICQQAKHENCKTPSLLSPLPIPANAWKDISMDFIDRLPKCEGYSVILVVVDRFILTTQTSIHNSFSGSGLL
jgi:hypothetical protein